MRPDRPIPRALPRPGIAALALGVALLAAPASEIVRGDDAPGAEGAKPAAASGFVLGTPIPPASPSDAEKDVGLVSLEANAGTVAGLRSDGRVLVRTGAGDRIVAPPDDAGAFRVLAVAGDGVAVVVTTRGRLVLLEEGGARILPLAVQRSAKPAAIPGSTDVVLGSENGSIRRLVRRDERPRLDDVVASGDEPVGALAAAADRVVYARLDGVVLEVPFAGGAPRVLARPSRAVSDVRVVGTTAYVLEGGAFAAVGEGPPRVKADGAPPASPPPEARAVAVSRDGTLVALVVGDAIEVRRLADGTRASTTALAPRAPSALAFEDDGRTLLVATSTDARPWRVPVEAKPAPAR